MRNRDFLFAEQVLPYMCEEQQNDIIALLEAADEIGTSATAMVTQGPQGFESLVQARQQFQDLLITTSKKYRIVAQR